MATAKKRLMEENTGYDPNTIGKPENIAGIVMKITSNLLGTRDLIEMNMLAMENLVPAIRECYTSMQKYPTYPSNFKGISTLDRWNKKLSEMKAIDSLTEDEVKQLKFDIDNIYDEFSNVISTCSLTHNLSLIHICRCRRIERCRSRWSPYH
eukprot:TRINITY_DN1180_c0_g1_i15.p1 TRINITY_DN1180_c0_g1~~TRINITY_DN1180_c0_g1_i15.p1  ORF type:complete len:152 (-),score=29.88 TRINITY_DN1180_c0_g1_i15:17-472(-)